MKRILILLCIILFSGCAMFSKTRFMDRVELRYLGDGTYIGEDKTFLSSVRLEVEVKQGKIIDIKIIEKSFTLWPVAAYAFKVIPESIIKRQSIDVDAVTTATISSNSIKRAVLDALEKAKGGER